jgi:hypothetical protein
MPRILATLATTLFLAWCAQAQELPTAAGGDAAGSGGSASFSVGQVAYTTPIGATGSVAQGVQQPYEISVTTSIAEVPPGITFEAYPNPAMDEVTVHTDAPTAGLRYFLHDAQGRLLLEQRATTQRQGIPMHGLASGIYHLSAWKGQQLLHTFRIVKH